MAQIFVSIILCTYVFFVEESFFCQGPDGGQVQGVPASPQCNAIQSARSQGSRMPI